MTVQHNIVVTAEIRKRMTMCLCAECLQERFGGMDDSDVIGMIEGALLALRLRGYQFTDDEHDEELFWARNGMMQ